jgi:hypothetical protein
MVGIETHRLTGQYANEHDPINNNAQTITDRWHHATIRDIRWDQQIIEVTPGTGLSSYFFGLSGHDGKIRSRHEVAYIGPGHVYEPYRVGCCQLQCSSKEPPFGWDQTQEPSEEQETGNESGTPSWDEDDLGNDRASTSNTSFRQYVIEVKFIKLRKVKTKFYVNVHVLWGPNNDVMTEKIEYMIAKHKEDLRDYIEKVKKDNKKKRHYASLVKRIPDILEKIYS